MQPLWLELLDGYPPSFPEGDAETFLFDPAVVLTSGLTYWVIVDSGYMWMTATSGYAGGNIGYTTHASDPTDNWTNNATFDVRQMKVNGELYVAPSGVISGRRGFTTRSGLLHSR